MNNKLEQIGNKRLHCVTLGSHKLFFSYATLIGIADGSCLFLTTTNFSKTTQRHKTLAIQYGIWSEVWEVDDLEDKCLLITMEGK